MKHIAILYILLIIFSNASSQDLTEENYFKGLKNIQHVSCDKEKMAYSAITKNNGFLHVDYNTVVDGENNSSYTFFFFTDGFVIGDKKDNLKLMHKYMPYIIETLSLDKGGLYSQLDKAIDEGFKQKGIDTRSVMISLNSNEYDEVYIIYTNNLNYVSIQCFFRRLF